MNHERSIHPPSRALHRSAIRSTGFSATWSVVTATTFGPCARTGHFCCYDEFTQTAYIGHGVDITGLKYFDLWALDIIKYRWRSIPLRGPVPPGRCGSRAVLYHGHLFVFGGYAGGRYLADLYRINVNTGEVVFVDTKGSVPTPRTTPILAQHADQLYVWGGFNGEWPNELSILDLTTMTWSVHPQRIAGRTDIPHVRINDCVYAYGGSRSDGLLTIDLNRHRLNLNEMRGTQFPAALSGAGMIAIDHFLILFGGRSDTDWTVMFACDLTKMSWFVFHIVPDGETVSIQDGSVNENGTFMLPRIHSFGMCFVKQTRQIIAFLGHPMKEHPPLFTFSCGEALSVIHLEGDMLSALNAFG
jgi:hypothetical protein